MSVVSKEVAVNCKGRDMYGNEVLAEAIPVTIVLRHQAISGANIVAEAKNCPHNTGGYGQRCMASDPEEDRFGRSVKCPFSFKYPYILRYKPNWKPPEAIAEAFLIAKDA